MKSLCVGTLVWVLLITLGICWAEIYTWVDENGVRHFSDAPTSGQLPADTGGEDSPAADETHPEPPPATVPAPGPAPSQKMRDELMTSISGLLENSKAEKSNERPRVELYVTDWCPWCRKAERFFKAEGVQVALYNVEKSRNARARLQSLTDYRGVPFAVVNGQKIEGYSPAAYRRALASGK